MKSKISHQKINKYLRQPEAELDLHGLTKDEANIALINFLTRARANRLLTVRIIVGQGRHSPDGKGILPDYVASLLRAKGYKFSQAKINEGGAGALIVKILL